MMVHRKAVLMASTMAAQSVVKKVGLIVDSRDSSMADL
jgi:hypothetical protein